MLAAATVHFPYMTAWPERASEADREATFAGFARLGEAFRRAEVDTIVAFTSEHIVNLQPRLAGSFIIGIGDRHEAFPEPQFNLQPVARPGDPELAQHLVQELYREKFDPAHSIELMFDHGTTLPLQLMQLPDHVAMVPIIINSIFAPLPSLDRCREFGEAVGRILRRWTGKRRVGLLATGGISHTVGAPGIDRNDPDFDAAFLEGIRNGDFARACGMSDASLDAAGNGTHEIRNWVAVAAAMHPVKPTVVNAIPYVKGWDSGVHQMLWAAS